MEQEKTNIDLFAVGIAIIGLGIGSLIIPIFTLGNIDEGVLWVIFAIFGAGLIFFGVSLIQLSIKRSNQNGK